MRNTLLAAALALAATLSIGGCSKSQPEPAGDPPKAEAQDVKIPYITVDEVAKGLADKSITAVDCNSDNTRKRMGAVPGAILVSDEETYAASELPADKATKLAFYCAGET